MAAKGVDLRLQVLELLWVSNGPAVEGSLGLLQLCSMGSQFVLSDLRGAPRGLEPGRSLRQAGALIVHRLRAPQKGFDLRKSLSAAISSRV